MDVTPGARLGSFEITTLIGSGGMGQVYRARDTRLERDVAIKVLPAAVADDPDRVARFDREAQVLASLSHPHIGAIFGVEEDTGVRFLVLELVEGGTLADRLRRGRVPLAEALELAHTIARALQAAHDKGIVHRDLKPSNIAFTAAGDAKVLDFGLAKLAADGAASPGTSMSPTITSPAQMTGAGVVLGTAAYMAPEQARGRPADKRSDLWSLGCVLYEMVTGRRAFDGDDVTETLANVLKAEPDWGLLPADTPAAVRVLLRRCLAKDPRQRPGDSAAVLLLIEEADHLQPGTAMGDDDAAIASSRARRAMAVAGALAVGMLLGGAVVWWATRPVPPRAEYMSIPLTPATMPRALANDRTIAITPDGSSVVWIADGNRRVYRRSVYEPQPRILAEVENARGVFVSSDGRSVGIIATPSQLLRVPLDGGVPAPIAVADEGTTGATWLDDDTIVFATLKIETGLQQVPAAGGEVSILTRPNASAGERDHVWPHAVPGHDLVVFTILGATAPGNQVALLDLRTRQYTTLVRGAVQGRYLSGGQLLYQAGGRWLVAPFDLDTRTATIARAVPVLENVPNHLLDVSSDGALVYLEGTADGARIPVAVGRQGGEEPLSDVSRAYQSPRVSPDGLRVAFHEAFQGQLDVWILDLQRGIVDQLTTDVGRDSEPIWSPEGDRIAYYSTSHPGGGGIFVRRADGTGTPERLTTGTHLPSVWSFDGQWIAYIDFAGNAIAPTTASSLMRVQVTGDRTPAAIYSQAGGSTVGRVSPQGDWIATVETTSGSDQVYVRPFSSPESGRVRISDAGGRDPVWSRDGRTLYFRNGQTVFSVDAVGPDPNAWRAHRGFLSPGLFTAPFGAPPRAATRRPVGEAPARPPPPHPTRSCARPTNESETHRRGRQRQSAFRRSGRNRQT